MRVRHVWNRGGSMMRLSVAVAVGAVTMAAAAAVAQPAPQQPPPLTNLQLYPKDTPRPQLIATMQGFVQALGVQAAGGCGYCHAGTAPAFDFASDAKTGEDRRAQDDPHG